MSFAKNNYFMGANDRPIILYVCLYTTSCYGNVSELTDYYFSSCLTSPSLPAFPPHICEEIKEGLPLIKKRLQSFGSTLSGSSPDSIPDDKELGHEVVADVLENSPQGEYCVILFNISTSIIFSPRITSLHLSMASS